MKLKPGTVAIEVPENGAPESGCFICRGPEKGTTKDALLVGMALGVRAMHTQERNRLCMKHETTLREILTVVCNEPDALTKLGIGFKIL